MHFQRSSCPFFFFLVSFQFQFISNYFTNLPIFFSIYFQLFQQLPVFFFFLKRICQTSTAILRSKSKHKHKLNPPILAEREKKHKHKMDQNPPSKLLWFWFWFYLRDRRSFGELAETEAEAWWFGQQLGDRREKRGLGTAAWWSERKAKLGDSETDLEMGEGESAEAEAWWFEQQLVDRREKRGSVTAMAWWSERKARLGDRREKQRKEKSLMARERAKPSSVGREREVERLCAIKINFFWMA